MRLRNILDVTLRDGASGLGFPFDSDATVRYVQHLRAVGIAHVEVGFISRPPRGPQAPPGSYGSDVTNLELMNILQGSPGLHCHRMVDSVEKGEDFPLLPPSPTRDLVRVVFRATDQTYLHDRVALVRASGATCCVNLKHAGQSSDRDVVRFAQSAVEAGAEVFYLADTGGMLTPRRTSRLVERIVSTCAIPVGFHGHDNRGLAVANSLAALEAGCRYVDASLGGVGAGAGNARLEHLVALCEDADEKAWPGLAAAAVLMKPYGVSAIESVDAAFGAAAGLGAGSVRQTVSSGRQASVWLSDVGVPLTASRQNRTFLRRSLGDDRVRKYFTYEEQWRTEVSASKEASAAGAPVVAYLDSGEDWRGPWLETRHVPGGSLLERVANAELPMASATELALTGLEKFASCFERDIQNSDGFVRAAVNERVPRRLEGWLQRSRSWPSRITRAERIRLNDLVLPTLQDVVLGLENLRKRLERPTEAAVAIHGDAHLGNCLLDGDSNVRFCDVQGRFRFGDVAYDLGKLRLSIDCLDLRLADCPPLEISEGIGGVCVSGDLFAPWIQEGSLEEARLLLRRHRYKEDADLAARTEIYEALHLIALAPTMAHHGEIAMARFLLEGLHRFGRLRDEGEIP